MKLYKDIIDHHSNVAAVASLHLISIYIPLKYFRHVHNLLLLTEAINNCNLLLNCLYKKIYNMIQRFKNGT